ncbi:LysR family transcriptional repressor of citA [Melghiribacillus thermohalophilus]|uniref:LysR family transcriptional repressor of citA n=1 Tax=Melghiribacillus thermohalophilus TaxID=1324956 RepID=A0A4R3MPV5_9BACI|nr:LysR family transcriptional regulator [Melghiribacillus thermohalophilus]TCT17585.1 LysR family transcriptional repressor of citA [Melghiribacillus thermohalophilus]
MDLNWLKTFITAAKFENFRKTAEALYISQPTVTVHIRLLEEKLGVSLFERTGRNIKLTEEGRRFVDHAEEILKKYQEGLEDLSSVKQGYKRKLRLGISPLIADTILPWVLKRFLLEYSDVEVQVKVIESTEIESSVLNNEMDLGISCLSVQNSSLYCDELYEDPVLFVVPHDGLDLESAPPFDEAELLSTNYLFTHSHPGYWDSLMQSIKYHYPFVKTIKVSQVHITKRFITEGLGVSYLPASTVRREMLEGRIIDVPSKLNLPIARTYAIYKYKHSVEQHFLEYVSAFRF